MAIVKIPEHQLDLTQTTAAISAEAAARQAADITLQGNIDAEQTARQAADNTLQTNITNEATARQSADSTLQANIDAEASARQAADTALSTNKLDKSEAASTYETITGALANLNSHNSGLNAHAAIRGVANGVATLDANALIPAAQLPTIDGGNANA